MCEDVREVESQVAWPDLKQGESRCLVLCGDGKRRQIWKERQHILLKLRDADTEGEG